MIIYINNAGLVNGLFVTDASIPLEVSEEQANMVQHNVPIGYAWQYTDNEFHLIQILSEEVIRTRRETECFQIVNRGQVWYSLLTDEQKSELTIWYKAWLDAPETKIVPDTPSWLK